MNAIAVRRSAPKSYFPPHKKSSMLLATSALGFAARRTLSVPRAPAIAPAVGQLRMMSDAAKKGYWVGNFTPLPNADMDEFASGYRAPMIESLGPFGGAVDGGSEARHGLLRR